MSEALERLIRLRDASKPLKGFGKKHADQARKNGKSGGRPQLLVAVVREGETWWHLGKGDPFNQVEPDLVDLPGGVWARVDGWDYLLPPGTDWPGVGVGEYGFERCCRSEAPDWQRRKAVSRMDLKWKGKRDRQGCGLVWVQPGPGDSWEGFWHLGPDRVEDRVEPEVIQKDGRGLWAKLGGVEYATSDLYGWPERGRYPVPRALKDWRKHRKPVDIVEEPFEI